MQQKLTTALQTGQLLAARRKALKVSQDTLAQRLGISQNRFSEIEQTPERITLDRLLVMANALNLELVLREKDDADSATKSEW